MDSDRGQRSARVPLPGHASGYPATHDATVADRSAPHRGDGIRHVRRVSNWTAAVLIVGTGAAAIALAHQAVPVSTPASGGTGATTGAGAAASTPGAAGPNAAHSVARTSASGVTTTTTTRVVNGKTVVTHVRHVPAYQDN